jgi:hypothetical protein
LYPLLLTLVYASRVYFCQVALDAMDDATHRIKKLERDKARRMGKEGEGEGTSAASKKLKGNAMKVANVMKMKAAMEAAKTDSKTGSGKTGSKTASKTGSGKMAGMAASAFGGSKKNLTRGDSKKDLTRGDSKKKLNETSAAEKAGSGKAVKPGLGNLAAMRAKLKVRTAPAPLALHLTIRTGRTAPCTTRTAPAPLTLHLHHSHWLTAGSHCTLHHSHWLTAVSRARAVRVFFKPFALPSANTTTHVLFVAFFFDRRWRMPRRRKRRQAAHPTTARGARNQEVAARVVVVRVVAARVVVARVAAARVAAAGVASLAEARLPARARQTVQDPARALRALIVALAVVAVAAVAAAEVTKAAIAVRVAAGPAAEPARPAATDPLSCPPSGAEARRRSRGRFELTGCNM